MRKIVARNQDFVARKGGKGVVNWLDRAVNAISPERALKREVARQRLSLINRDRKSVV